MTCDAWWCPLQANARPPAAAVRIAGVFEQALANGIAMVRLDWPLGIGDARKWCAATRAEFWLCRCAVSCLLGHAFDQSYPASRLTRNDVRTMTGRPEADLSN